MWRKSSSELHSDHKRPLMCLMIDLLMEMELISSDGDHLLCLFTSQLTEHQHNTEGLSLWLKDQFTNTFQSSHFRCSCCSTANSTPAHQNILILWHHWPWQHRSDVTCSGSLWLLVVLVWCRLIIQSELRWTAITTVSSSNYKRRGQTGCRTVVVCLNNCCPVSD